MSSMQRQDFFYELPAELIAKYPTEQRTASRLLNLDSQSGEVIHQNFHHIVEQLQANDILVFNNTKVIPARLFGQKQTGGKVEVLVERLLNTTEALVQIRASKPPKQGSLLTLEQAIDVQMLGRQGDLFHLKLVNESSDSLLDLLQQYGHMPLPPYIDRSDEATDLQRYQTVYAKQPGAVAAPTAGLHFDEELLAQIQAKGVETAFVTLHVGAGTFQPVRVDDIQQHQMHKEWLVIDQSTCQQIQDAKARGGRVIAVGTTAVRVLETASQSGELQPFEGDTNIFIYPGYRFNSVEALLTNFHLPESTLLMLVSAFAGMENIRQAYAAAIAEQYRFFSYGDAMFIHGGQNLKEVNQS